MYNQNHKRLSIVLTIVSFMVMFLLSAAHAADLTLTWTKPDDSRVVGYNIYCGVSGTDSTSAPVQTINSPDQTSCLITNLEEGQVYGFTATSFDAGGNESDFATSINHLVAVTPVDNDGDGYTVEDGDCNDNDATIYPGAIEICGDGIDQDCDGIDLICVVDPDTQALTFGNTLDADYPGTVVDTFINLNPEVNYADDQLNTYTWPENMAANAILIQFDLTQLPAGAQIQSATLSLYQNAAGGDASYDIGAHKVINHNPDLFQATGYTCNGVNGWTANNSCYNSIPLAQGDIAPAENVNRLDHSLGYKEWDVTGMVQEWANDSSTNYGLMLNSDAVAGSDSYRFFASSEAIDAAQRPRLELVLTSTSTPIDPEDIDNDGDGVTENQGDCNDNDSSIHPGANEICGDGIDQDCNGSDLICPENIDNDGDMYTENEGDCNDNDATIYPGAVEICGDGIDQDCNGSDLECTPDPNDVDDDGDGYTENEGDCSDNDATIFPGAIEICGDGIDQDCNGSDLECIPDDNNNTQSFVFETGEVELNHQWQFVSYNKTFVNPVVVVRSPSLNGGDPGVVRVKNVSPSGFEVRFQEWDYRDGNHIYETVGYMVMEAGHHVLPNGIHVEAGTIESNSSQKTVNFGEAFNQIPVVISGVTTENELDAVTGRMSNITLNTFDILLQDQESDKSGHTNETIAYIAWEPSSGEVDGKSYIVDSTFDEVTHNFYNINFYPAFSTAPVFVADMQTTDGGDTANIRWRNKNGEGIEVQIDEEQSQNPEVNHTTEVVGYMAFATVEPTNSFSLAVNFQPGSVEIPEGYLVDSGMSFDSEAGYGWMNGPSSYGAKDRNSIESADQSYDTMIHVLPSSIWEAELPNGTYTVRLCMGDASWPQGIQNVQIEDAAFLDNGLLSYDNRWIEKEMAVEVTDGRLSVTFAGSHDPAKLCWIKIN